jgi:hypothetical protein
MEVIFATTVANATFYYALAKDLRQRLTRSPSSDDVYPHPSAKIKLLSPNTTASSDTWVDFEKQELTALPQVYGTYRS